MVDKAKPVTVRKEREDHISRIFGSVLKFRLASAGCPILSAL
jgi:hypothetical protein